MNGLKNKGLVLSLTGLVSLSMVTLPFSSAYAEGSLDKDVKTIIKHAAVGMGIGAITGGVSDRTSALKGAGIGALTGAGTGVVESSDTLKKRPLVKNTAKGAIVGTGVSATTGGSKLKGAAIGAGAGAGWQLLKDYLGKKDSQ